MKNKLTHLLLVFLIMMSNLATAQITVSAATGNNVACVGSPSANPNIQQFVASGTGLTANIVVTAPADFEVSTSVGSGYANSLTLVRVLGVVLNTNIYVRSASTAPVGTLAGNVTLTSTGTATRNVAVAGTVNSIPTVDLITSQQLCNNDATAAISFTGAIAGTVYNWTNNTPSIGLAASGSGNIPSFTVSNSTNAPISATITVTPSYTNAGLTCVGTPTTFTLLVNPTPITNVVPSQTKCNGSPSNLIAFSGNIASTVFNWVNDNTSIGLAASGTGNIAPFTLINTTANPITANVSVTPTYTNGAITCTGATTTSSITVNPTATVDVVPSQVVCPNSLTNAINFSSPSAGFPASTIVYNWTNTNPSIGLPSTGSGNIPAFTATNDTNTPLHSNITVTPVYTYNGVSCTGTATTFTITVQPSVTVNTVANQVLCNGSSTAAINFSSAASGGSVTYDWINSDPTIGIPAIGSGNIGTFTAINTTLVPIVATITVTPTLISGSVSCVGTPRTFTITVNPTATVNAVANQDQCNGDATTAIIFTSPTGGGGGSNIVFNWVNNTPFIGLAASGTGDIASFVANNATLTPVTATITVTPTYTNGGVSCAGTPRSFNITVLPTVTVNPVANQVFCNGLTTPVINFSSPNSGGTINYTWDNSNPSIGLAAFGSGELPSFTATNTTSSPITAIITVRPQILNTIETISCNGTSRSFTITVNPTTTANPVADQVLCANTSTATVNFSSPVAGTTYTWVNNNPSIGLAASGSGNIPSFTAIGSTSVQTATITATPTANGCVGAPISFTITVNPMVTVNAVSNQILCNGSSTAAIVFSSPNTGGIVTYDWINSNPTIGIAASGSGNIPTFIATNTTVVPVVATITVTPTFTNLGVSCTGTPTTFTITVNPTATVNLVGNQNSCNGEPTIPFIFTSPNTGGSGSNIVFNWVNNTPAIGLAASGTGDIASFVATNTTMATLVATITVTPTYTNGGVSCVGTDLTFTISVMPTPVVNAVGNQNLCNNTSTSAINFSTPNTGLTIDYEWENDNPSIGLAAIGFGNIPSFVAINTGSAPVTATITVTPVTAIGFTACYGQPITFSITVNPTAIIDSVANQTICANTSTTPIVFTTPISSNVVFNWVNNTPSIGLASSGTGNIPSFIGINNTSTPLNATITVTPSYTNNGISCNGLPRSFTITVNPNGTVSPVANQSLCNNNATAAINFTTGNTNGTTVYNWVNNTPSIGLAANGTGNIASFIATNNTNASVTAIITVTPTFTNGSVSCVGTSTTFTITVHPTAEVSAVPDQVLCANEVTAPIVFVSTVPGTTYTWVNNNPSIGLAASGTGNIPSFTTANNLTNATTATITVTPSGATSCTGATFSFAITVNPIASVNTVANQVLCNGSSVAPINFGSSATGGVVTYNWTNNAPSIGVAANGTGNIPTFIATNTTTAPVVATITVTPTFTNLGVSCTGTPTTFTITVNPTATINAVANQTLCNGANTTAINFTSPNSGNGGSNVVFNWVNNNSSIGLAASGTGNIGTFTASNTTTAPLVATITVTPVYTNAGITCAGTATTFTITVLPVMTVNSVVSQVLCNGTSTTPIVFSSPNSGGVLNYTWDNDNPSIGLAAFGTDNINPFIATNTTGNPITANITVTPRFLNTAETLSCTGTPITFTITVNPTPTVNAVSNQEVCNGASTTAINFTGAATGTVYNWTNSSPGIGLAASGTGNIASFAAINTGTSPVTATITVTPSYDNAGITCIGASTTFTIVVNPIATVNTVSNQVLCNGNSTAAISFSSSATGGVVTYNWTNTAPSIGIAANGTGNIPSFIATNTTINPVVATITVTPTFTNGAVNCVGTTTSFTIIVNPTATVNAVANQVLCNGSNTTAINFTSTNSGNGGSNVVFNWVNNTPSIGLAANGFGNIPSFTTSNITTAPVTATITVTPVYTNAGVTCTGTAITFTITVNPTAIVNAINNQTLCANNPTNAINFSSPYTGGSIVYNWVNNAPSIGLAASGSGNIVSFTALNTTSAPITASITVTPVLTNGGVSCTGIPTTFTIIVNPTGVVNAVSNQVLCGNETVTPIVFSSPVAGTTYSWVNNNPSIGLTASGIGNIPSFVTANNLTNAITATITVTPTSPSGCTGAPISFTITVNPIATVNVVNNQVLCNGSSTAAISFSSPATGGVVTYNWTNTEPSIGIAASGSGNIPTFIATNTTTVPLISTITVTPTFTNGSVNCIGAATTFTITVNPTATVNAVQNQVLCNGSNTTAITFVSSNSGNGGSNVIFNWTSNNTSIGLAASGTGNIGSFTAVNNTLAPVTATIIVTPAYTNAGVTCTGTPISFTITVNPTTSVNPVSNQLLCTGSATTAINFSSPNNGGVTVYNWVNNTPSIGLAASGSGNIGSFIATNTGTVPVTANITVTPVLTNGTVSCSGTPITFNITVQPSGVVNAMSNQTVCANTTTAPIAFTSPVSGTTYTWVNNNPSIGLAASGVGNIPSFVAANTTNSINATITVTPNTPFGCVGSPISFVITVNPIPTINPVVNQVRCNGALTDTIKFTSTNGTNGGGNIIYNWTNSAPSIGIPASGSGNINPFVVTNTGSIPVVAIITVTPSFVNGTPICIGIPITFSITVNPTATVNAIANQTLCAGQATSAVNFTGSVAGTTYSWINSNTAIGLAASGIGNIPSFIAQNNTLSTISGTLTVIPNTTAGCIGASRSFDYVVQALSVAPTAIATSITGPALLVCDTNRRVTLNVVGGGLGTGAVWRWYKDSCGGVPIGTGTTLPNFDVTQTTTFYVRAEGTCNTTSCATVTIQVGKLVTHIRQHWKDVLFFDNSSNNFVAWQWYKDGVILPGATLQHYSENGVALNGQYYCIATDRSNNRLITCPINCTTNGFHGIKLVAIPNPINKGQQFKMQSSLTPAELQGARYTISDLFGTAVSQTVATSSVTTMQAPANSGMYIVALVLTNGQRYSITILVN